MIKKIILSCDDLGISKSTNLTILKCINEGIASSASLLVNTPWYDHALNEVVPKIQNKIGIHLNLTIGKSLLQYNKIPDLVNMDGYFIRKSHFFYFLNFFNSKKIIRQIYKELSAQIKKAKKDDIIFSHIDSQEHIHMSPIMNKIFIKLMKKNKINKMRIVREKILYNDLFKNFVFKFTNLNFLKSVIIKISQLFNKYKYSSPISFYSIINIGIISKKDIINLLKTDPGLIEISMHPGEIVDETFYKDYNDNTYMFLKSPNRVSEKKTLMDTDLKKIIEEHNYKIVSFSEL